MDAPSATYRGFRNQALYALARLLNDDNISRNIYRPEGGEDLAIYEGPRLVEVVQVKDFTSALAISHFKPGSSDGFLARMRKRRAEHPGCKHVLVSFGPLGPELAGAISGEHEHRQTVINKIVKADADRLDNEKAKTSKKRSKKASIQTNIIPEQELISKEEAALLLEELRGNVIFVDAVDLRASVINALEGTNAGVHIDSAIELLLFWIFDASEHLRPLTRATVIQQIDNIGRYLAALRDYSVEWGGNLRPITDEVLSADEASRLRTEYRQGVQAHWRHILADSDVPRPDRINDLHAKLSLHSAVIIRGASGQGKSTLGWRYMRDFGVAGLRFQVKMVGSREHALRIANALKSHVLRLQLQAIVYLDLSPTDTGWVELLKDLIEAGMKVIVAVREEDFRRAGVSIGSIDFAEVALTAVTYSEAKHLFSSFPVTPGLNAETPLNFEEAWARFGSEDGVPLLEFAHWVTQGRTLQAKLDTQVLRLQHEAATGQAGMTPAHLALLGSASVAAAAGCSVELAHLCQSVLLNPLTRPLAYLEDEYLIRVTDEGSLQIEGLHAIRSQAIVDALLKDCPQEWPTFAALALPSIPDSQLETFLLFCFSRHGLHRATIEKSINLLILRSWTHAAGVVRGLLWEGLNRYEQENSATLVNAIGRLGGGWYLGFDSSVGMKEDAAKPLRDTMTSMNREIPLFAPTPKTRVFEPLRAWAKRAQVPPEPPQGSEEWADLGDVAFWLARIQAQGAFTEIILRLLPDLSSSELRLPDLGRFLSGRAAFSDFEFREWMNGHSQVLATRFVDNTNSIHLDDDGTSLILYCPMILDDNTEPGRRRYSQSDWHGRVMERLELLRQVFPCRQSYGSDGFVLEITLGALNHDPTGKRIPVENFPIRREVELNSRFKNIVEYRHLRSPSWSVYVDAILTFRRATTAAMEALSHIWKAFLIPGKIPPQKLKGWPKAKIEEGIRRTSLPKFPRQTTDEWGFVSENLNAIGPAKQMGLSRNMRNLDEVGKALGDYSTSVSNALSQSDHFAASFVRFKNEASTTPDGRLFLVNLGNAWKRARTMAGEFRKTLGDLLSTEQLDTLEISEQSTFYDLWFVAYALHFSPAGVVSFSHLALREQTGKKRASLLSMIESEARSTLADIGKGSSIRIDSSVSSTAFGMSLKIICDHVAFDAIDESRGAVVLSIAKAVRSVRWLDLEWQPLEVEWPKISIVHLFRGRALRPSAASIDTSLFFVQAAAFEVKFHHTFESYLPAEDLQAHGLSIWDTPAHIELLSLCARLSGFSITAASYEALLESIADRSLPDDSMQRPLEQFSRELSGLWQELWSSYTLALSLLAAFASSSGELHLLERWRTVLTALFERIVLQDFSSTPEPDFPSLRKWATHIRKDLPQISNLLRTFMEHSSV
jgi:hypothetical protein